LHSNRIVRLKECGVDLHSIELITNNRAYINPE
jgi:hypothetical protein